MIINQPLRWNVTFWWVLGGNFMSSFIGKNEPAHRLFFIANLVPGAYISPQK